MNTNIEVCEKSKLDRHTDTNVLGQLRWVRRVNRDLETELPQLTFPVCGDPLPRACPLQVARPL